MKLNILKDGDAAITHTKVLKNNMQYKQVSTFKRIKLRDELKLLLLNLKKQNISKTTTKKKDPKMSLKDHL